MPEKQTVNWSRPGNILKLFAVFLNVRCIMEVFSEQLLERVSLKGS